MARMNGDSKGGPGLSGFALRMGFALLLVYATYNPFGVSYVSWLTGEFAAGDESSWLASPAAKFVVGVVLAIAWVVYANATRRSLGGVGIFLVVALCAGVIWLLVDRCVFSMSNLPALTHVGLIVVALVMAVGMTWSHTRRRLTGQVDTDDVETH